jgi:D-threo-aldose 1-dehydrogenase
MNVMNNIIGQDVVPGTVLSGAIGLPPVIFGTSGLGNLFVGHDYPTKLNIVSECVRVSTGKVVFDSAGKYGAGLALETLGKCLEELKVPKDKVIISNKLGWVRTELKTAEPTFEPGVWKNLEHDAVQKISYEGILECFEQGNELLGGYSPQMLSVHDPDEYLAKAKNQEESNGLFDQILDAYRALYDLKKQGKVQAIGVGAKDWRIIQKIAAEVELDWVMFANSMTIKKHPAELLAFMKELVNRGVYIINSAVFHSGFLVGSDYFDYKLVTPAKDPDLFLWREEFFAICKKYNVKPAEACVQFALKAPGVKSIALNTTEVKRVKQNMDMVKVEVAEEFWKELKEKRLINIEY